MAMIQVVVEDASILGKMPVPTAFNRRINFHHLPELMFVVSLVSVSRPNSGRWGP